MSRNDPFARQSVLIVEDDPVIGHHLAAGLDNNGYQTRWCRTGAGALAQARESSPSIVLLDLGLPDVNGLDLARTIRNELHDVLLLIITARSDEIDVIVGLDAGADDYLVKPFSLTVLLARLRAHLRRRPDPGAEAGQIQVGDLTVDLSSRRCLVGDEEIPLRPKEFDLLAVLAAQPGVAVSREELMSQVWDENWYGPTKTLDVTMAALRRRLIDRTPSTASPARYTVPAITTLRGHGYRLEQVARG